MSARVARALAVLALAGAVAAGCAGAPAPTETTPTPLSDEQAFAAAEATYRAYVDAVNARRVDEHSTPSPQDFLMGEALDVDLETMRQLKEQGLTVIGETQVISVAAGSISESKDQVELLVCLDSSQGRVIDANGNDVTPAGREQQPALAVEMVLTGTEYLISDSRSAEESC